MMTEKRFKAYGNNFIAIDDNVENKTYYLNEDVDRIVDLLNSLWEENERLKQWNKCLAEKRHNEKESNENSIKKLIGKIDFLERIIDGDL